MANFVVIVGRLGADPETRTTGSGVTISNLRVATNDFYNGEKRTEWHNVVTFGKTAENVSKFLSKGALVAVQGSLRTRTWTGRDGVERRVTEIVANRVDFLDSRNRRDTAPRPTDPASPAIPDDDLPF